MRTAKSSGSLCRCLVAAGAAGAPGTAARAPRTATAQSPLAATPCFAPTSMPKCTAGLATPMASAGASTRTRSRSDPPPTAVAAGATKASPGTTTGSPPHLRSRLGPPPPAWAGAAEATQVAEGAMCRRVGVCARQAPGPATGWSVFATGLIRVGFLAGPLRATCSGSDRSPASHRLSRVVTRR